jgi:hypothetical protein
MVPLFSIHFSFLLDCVLCPAICTGALTAQTIRERKETNLSLIILFDCEAHRCAPVIAHNRVGVCGNCVS